MTGDLYPFRLAGRPVARVWGVDDTTSLLGRRLESKEPIGEVWTLGDWEGGDRILDGPQAGRTVMDLVGELGKEAILGSSNLTPTGRFPLLVKWIASSKDLSIQVHPDEEAALDIGGGAEAKTECWYVLGADPGGSIVYGVKPGISPEEVGRLARHGGIEGVLNKVEVHTGDVAYVPSGMVHAICAGVRLVEVQQNSDTTFRLYDYGRPGLDGKPRTLHVEQAVRSMKTSSEPPSLNPALQVDMEAGKRVFRAACRHFWIEELSLERTCTFQVQCKGFMFLSVLEGKAGFSASNVCVHAAKSDGILLPSGLDSVEVEVETPLKALACGVPDLESDVIAVLRDAGYSNEQIASLGGVSFGNDLADLLW